jgi:hypothetical protein
MVIDGEKYFGGLAQNYLRFQKTNEKTTEKRWNSGTIIRINVDVY